MTSNQSERTQRFVGYRVGDTYCLSPTLTLSAIAESPEKLVQLPGSKAWLMGVARMGKELVPYINLPHFLSLPGSDAKDKPYGSPVLIMKDASGTGSVGLKVDELVDFIPTNSISDDGDTNYAVPVGLGSCLCGTVQAKGRTWALIDLMNILNDPKLQKIDLS